MIPLPECMDLHGVAESSLPLQKLFLWFTMAKAYKGKSLKPGGGGRFQRLLDKGVPAGKAAQIGRKKYGHAKMTKWSQEGKERPEGLLRTVSLSRKEGACGPFVFPRRMVRKPVLEFPVDVSAMMGG